MKINVSLDRDFENKFIELKEKYGDDMLKLEGLSNKQLDTTAFFDNFINSNNVANASIDDNSNVNNKNISVMISESRKPWNKLFSRNKLYLELKQEFGKETADRWLELQINGALYEHDSQDTSFKPYCYAYSLKDMVEKGLYFVKDMKGQPAKHLDTFNSHVKEFVSFASNQQSGAVGIPDYLIYSFYFWKKDIKEKSLDKKDSIKLREQNWQQILFSLNQPFLKGQEQSAYTNFSILDREHIIGFFGMDKFPDNTLIIDYIEEIIKYQKDFLDFERKLRYEKFFTFPVISASLLFQNGKYIDEDMAKFVCKHNLTWQDVNIYNAKDVNGVASCCFDKNQYVAIKIDDSEEIIDDSFEELYNNFNHRNDFKIFNNNKWSKGKIIKIPRKNKKMFRVTTINNQTMELTEDHINITNSGEKMTKELTTNDYISYCNGFADNFIKDYIIKNNQLYIKIKDIKRIEGYNEKFVYCFEMEDKYNPCFTLSNGINTHNCRLISSSKDIEEKNKLTGHFNSIGGSSISIGSAKVNTLNLVRIALESKGDFNKYLNILKDRVDISHKLLFVHRNVLKKNTKRGLLPIYSEKLMNMDNQFSTIGINGMFEAIKLLGGIKENANGAYYTENGLQMAKDILNTISKLNENTLEKYGFNCNIEQIPGESASIKLCKKDKLLFGDKTNTYIYGNQWIPLNVQASLIERIRVASILDTTCGGGVMLHCNLGEGFKDEEEAWVMMEYMAKKGVIYYSFIMKINACELDHSFYGEICPICHRPKSESYIKIVGYLVKQSSYKSERAKEMDERKFYNINQNNLE